MALVTWGRTTRTFSVEQLSIGDAVLTGLPTPDVGERVRVLLQLTGRRPVYVDGMIRRHHPHEGGTPSVSVEFLDVPVEVEDAIDDAIVDSLRDPAPRSGTIRRR